MTTTQDLIGALAANVQPVRRLRPPLARATAWLLLATLILVLIGIGHGLRPNIAERFGDTQFAFSLIGSLATGLLAAIAAFLLCLPDRSRLWLLLPVPAFVLWMATLGQQCLSNWVNVGPNGMSWGETAACFATLGLTSLPLSLALYLMMRPSAAWRPPGAALAGSLAIAAISATALSLFHPLDATIMVVMFNVGVTVAIVGGRALLGIANRTLFSEPSPFGS